MTATAAAQNDQNARPARRPAKVPPSAIRQLEIEVAGDRSKKTKLTGYMPADLLFNQLGSVAKEAKNCDGKKERKELAKRYGMSEEQIKYLAKSGKKEVKDMVEEFERHKKFADMKAFMHVMEKRGLEIHLKKGKNKTTDAFIDSLNDEQGSGWSWGKIAMAVGGAVVAGVVIHEGYQYFTGGSGLISNYGPAGGGHTFDNEAGMANVAQMR